MVSITVKLRYVTIFMPVFFCKLQRILIFLQPFLQVRVVMARQVDDSKDINSIGASGTNKSPDSMDIFTTTDRHGRPLKASPPNETTDNFKSAEPPKVVIPPKGSTKKSPPAAPPDENDYRPYTKESSYDKMKRLVLPSSSFPRTEEIEPRDQF